MNHVLKHHLTIIVVVLASAWLSVGFADAQVAEDGDPGEALAAEDTAYLAYAEWVESLDEGSPRDAAGGLLVCGFDDDFAAVIPDNEQVSTSRNIAEGYCLFFAGVRAFQREADGQVAVDPMAMRNELKHVSEVVSLDSGDREFEATVHHFIAPNGFVVADMTQVQGDWKQVAALSALYQQLGLTPQQVDVRDLGQFLAQLGISLSATAEGIEQGDLTKDEGRAKMQSLQSSLFRRYSRKAADRQE